MNSGPGQVARARPTPAAAVQRICLTLSCANFAQGLGAFAVLGIVPLVAQALSAPLWQAALLISVYAAAYAVSSPVLVSLLGAIDRTRVLFAGLALLAAGAFAATLAPNLPLLLLARVVMAVGGGIITPVAAAIGSAIAPAAQRGRALGTIFAGLTLSQALGVPLGAWLAGHAGWRATFALTAATAVAALFLVRAGVPRGVRVPATSLETLGSVLRVPRLLVAISFIVCFIGANFVLLTYLVAFMTERHGLGSTAIAAMLMGYGCAAVLGNLIGARLTDRFGAVRTLTLLCCLQMVLLPTVTLADLSLAGRVVAVLAWSSAGWAVHVPQQSRLTHLGPARAPVLLALHSAALYVGSSVGSAVAAAVLRLHGYDALGPAGAVLIALGLLSLAWHGRSSARRRAARGCPRTPGQGSGSSVARGSPSGRQRD